MNPKGDTQLRLLPRVHHLDRVRDAVNIIFSAVDGREVPLPDDGDVLEMRPKVVVLVLVRPCPVVRLLSSADLHVTRRQLAL